MLRWIALGNPETSAPAGDGVSKLGIDYGLGYRLYYKQISSEVVRLLVGGDKRCQTRDIARVLAIADGDHRVKDGIENAEGDNKHCACQAGAGRCRKRRLARQFRLSDKAEILQLKLTAASKKTYRGA